MRAGLIPSILLSAVLVAGMPGGTAALAKDDLPEVSDDGLQRVETKKVDALYWKEGASLAPYKRINILDCFVAFRKNWERDQNDTRDLYRVTAEDMEKIKSILAEEFRREFTKELQDKGGYQITDEVGEDVLLLRPAIVNLDVNAPDISQPGRVDNYVTSAGEMTLYMELFDSATSSIIGRVIDAREGLDTGVVRTANSVTNKAEADRLLRIWASSLREALDEHWSGQQ